MASDLYISLVELKEIQIENQNRTLWKRCFISGSSNVEGALEAQLLPFRSLLHEAMPSYAELALLVQVDEWDANRPYFNHPDRGDCYFNWKTIVAATTPTELNYIQARYNNNRPFIRYENDGVYCHIQSYKLREILVTYLLRVKAIEDAEICKSPTGLSENEEEKPRAP